MVKYEDTTLEQRKKALDDAWTIHNLKVFCIGDTARTWIVAENEESAITFYSEKCGTPVNELYEMGVEECDKEETLLWRVSDVPKEDVHIFKVSESNNNYLHVPFNYSIGYMDVDLNVPFVIGTTEGE